jgi:polygalacturonase
MDKILSAYERSFSVIVKQFHIMKEISRRKWLGVFTTAAVGAGVLNTSSTSAADKAKTDNFNIKDYGAIGDGKTLNTKAIQKAIDACHQQNGGTVIIPAGVFICSTLELKSNVTLHVTAGGKLLGSPKREDYTAGKGVPPGNGNIVFLYAVNANNVSIEGKGSIETASPSTMVKETIPAPDKEASAEISIALTWLYFISVQI